MVSGNLWLCGCTPTFSLPATNNLISIQGLSFLTDYGEANLNYERIIRRQYGVSGTLAGYLWPARNSILDRNDHEVAGFGLKLGGKRYFSLDKYFRTDGG